MGCRRFLGALLWVVEKDGCSLGALGFGAVGLEEFHCADPGVAKEWFLYRIGVIRELLS